MQLATNLEGRGAARGLDGALTWPPTLSRTQSSEVRGGRLTALPSLLQMDPGSTINSFSTLGGRIVQPGVCGPPCPLPAWQRLATSQGVCRQNQTLFPVLTCLIKPGEGVTATGSAFGAPDLRLLGEVAVGWEGAGAASGAAEWRQEAASQKRVKSGPLGWAGWGPGQGREVWGAVPPLAGGGPTTTVGGGSRHTVPPESMLACA